MCAFFPSERGPCCFSIIRWDYSIWCFEKEDLFIYVMCASEMESKSISVRCTSWYHPQDGWPQHFQIQWTWGNTKNLFFYLMFKSCLFMVFVCYIIVVGLCKLACGVNDTAKECSKDHPQGTRNDVSGCQMARVCNNWHLWVTGSGYWNPNCRGCFWEQ